jgi:Meiotically up-regulated gene 113
MLRADRRYKIGFTKSPARRFREVRLELPDEIIQVHAVETDDPMGVEGYWHKRFALKRIKDSEWFELDANDVRAFNRRNYQ